MTTQTEQIAFSGGVQMVHEHCGESRCASCQAELPIVNQLYRESRFAVTPTSNQIMEEIGTLREVVGLPNCALPISPRAAMMEAVNIAKRLYDEDQARKEASDE